MNLIDQLKVRPRTLDNSYTMTDNSSLKSVSSAEILKALNDCIDMNEVSFVFALGTQFSVDANIFTLDYWLELRKNQRKMTTTINWPENLSKKEKVICKLKLIRSLLEYSEIDPEPAEGLHRYLTMFLDQQIVEIFKFQKVHPGETWKGLSAESAKFLNLLHTKLNSSYKTYLSNTYGKRN